MAFGAVHLPPLDFTGWPWVAYGLLACVWLLGRRWMSRRESERWFFWFVVGTALIASGGFWLAGGPGLPSTCRITCCLGSSLVIRGGWKVLKLYPFRLFDAMLPIAVAITVAGLARRWCELACQVVQSHAAAPHGYLIWFLCGVPALLACLSVASDAGPQMTAAELADWLDACGWIKANTPPDALILTPTQESWAFKWYAQRAEYVCYKDCPQDGPGIIEWNKRLLYLSDWTERHLETGYTAADLATLRQQGMCNTSSHWDSGRSISDPSTTIGTFRVYRIPDK